MGNDHLLGNGNLMNEFSEQSDSTFQVLDSKIKQNVSVIIRVTFAVIARL